MKFFVIQYTFRDLDGEEHGDTAGFRADSYGHALEQLIDERKDDDGKIVSIDDCEESEDAPFGYHE